jgi:periplasmic protein TonB
VAPKRKKSPVGPIIIGVVVVAVLVGGVLLIRSFLGGAKVQQPKIVQEVHLIRPPPPPPPEEKPPPPPPPEEKVVTPQDQPKPDPTPDNQPPPSQNLGLDAEGGAGGDAFGLVGNKGGRDLVGGGGGSAVAWYGNLVKNEVMERLSSDKALRTGNYQVQVRFWFTRDGTVEKTALVKGSGDRERDRSIETELSGLTRFSQPPPAGVPSPITLAVTFHG